MVKNALLVLTAAGALVACASVADLEVKYSAATSEDAGPTIDGVAPPSGDSGGLAIVTPKKEAPPARATGGDPILTACACNPEVDGANFCCATAAGPICTDDQSACEAQSGTFLRCTGPNNEGEPCCLSLHPTGAETALAASCAEGHPTVCSTDRDCPNEGKCTLGTCPGNISVGTCDGTPVCPL